MVDLNRLRVSLTKNGYFKVAELLKAHSRWQILENAEGVYDGIDIKPSQIGNILDINPANGQIPTFWDSIRDHGFLAIDAFSLVAMLFSHERLIRLFQAASQGRPEFRGYFLRTDLPQNKEYTNLSYALGCFGVSNYRKGANAVEYNLTPAIFHLRNLGSLILELLKSKLQRAGWVDPALNPLSRDRELLAEIRHFQFNRVFSMEWDRFEEWIGGRLQINLPVERFGLREVRLFNPPIPIPSLNRS